MYNVFHNIFGNGNLTFIDDSHVRVVFDNDVVKNFLFPSVFDKFLISKDDSLTFLIESAKEKIRVKEELRKKELENKLESIKEYSIHKLQKKDPVKKDVLVGSRSRDVKFNYKNNLFEAIGYFCTPNRILHISAEIPCDGREIDFESNYPGQPYAKINIDYDENGMPTKMSASYRIIFKNVNNCPEFLQKELVDDGSYAARLNRTAFIANLVNNYGFRFGNSQDVDKIKDIAIKAGYEEDFNRGYNR